MYHTTHPSPTHLAPTMKPFGSIPPYQPPQPHFGGACPACGYCPCCGRRNYAPYTPPFTWTCTKTATQP